MPKKESLNPADYIEPLYMNGLHGRMLRIKAKPRKTKELMLVYGQHTSLERMFGIAESLNKYGGVTIPDLPGFGGMQSFYRLREKPTMDNLADYLAAFVKLRYKNRRVTIIGISFGFAIATRMLQRYPELVKKVDLLVSVAGFVHNEDLSLKKHNYWLLRYSAAIFSKRLPASVAKHAFLRPSLIKATYLIAGPKSVKLSTADVNERDKRIAFEIHLWRTNDLRTYMFSTTSMLKLDLCNGQVDLPVHHVSLLNDQYIKSELVEQHLNVIYSQVTTYSSKLTSLAPTLSAKNDVSQLTPPALKKLLTKQ